MAPLADTGQILLAHYELFSAQFLASDPDLLQATVSFIEKTDKQGVIA